MADMELFGLWIRVVKLEGLDALIVAAEFALPALVLDGTSLHYASPISYVNPHPFFARHTVTLPHGDWLHR